MSSKLFFRAYLGGAIFCWLLICLIEFLKYHLDITISELLTEGILSAFYLLVFLIFKIQVGAKSISNFNDYLWQVFVVGGATVIISLLFKFSTSLIHIETLKENTLWLNLIYHINTGLMVIFLANGFYVWKKLILYQKTKINSVIWVVFEILVLLSVLTNFVVSEIYSTEFLMVSLPLSLLGLYLSFNLKWVAFLNYKQKWQSIAFVFLIMIICFTFIEQVFELRKNNSILVNMASNTFVVANFGYLIINCLASFLVLLFHLPTSSIFEKKFGEVMIFQRLSQTISMGDSEDEVYQMLLESSLTTVMADAAWLEIVNEKGNYEAFINKEIDEFDIFEIKKVLRKNDIRIDTDPHYVKDIREYDFSERLKSLPYRSMLVIPLMSNNQKLGSLVLLKNLADGFDKEMVDIVFSFVSQASLAIKNFRLIHDALENERYKEELKIAKEVQKSLFPETLMVSIDLEINAFSKAADEVGGDYYDVYKYSDTKVIVVIGDVSGNGTSAAFNMAQMKGVFHSLVQLNLSADEFMNHANSALSRCLEKKSFITLSVFYIDLETKTIEHARAGHCPTLFYNNATQLSYYIESPGLGLGIIRKKDYLKHIKKTQFQYAQGDIMVLYSDGIIEAVNSEGEEFGYDRLKNILQENATLSTKQLGDCIVNELYAFTGTRFLNDDYSYLVIKFI